MLHHPHSSPDVHTAYEAAINRVIPKAERIVNEEAARAEANGRGFNWDRRFHEVMNQLTRQEKLRSL